MRSVESSLDLENRAHYLTISIQRWLGVRLGLFGNILVLGIALFAAAYRKTIHPSKIGVILAYTLNSKALTRLLQAPFSNRSPLVTQTFCKFLFVLPLLRTIQ